MVIVRVCVFVCGGVSVSVVCACASACAHVCVCVCVCINAGIPDCPASDQSGRGMKKSNDAGTYPVPDKADVFQHFFGPVLD